MLAGEAYQVNNSDLVLYTSLQCLGNLETADGLVTAAPTQCGPVAYPGGRPEGHDFPLWLQTPIWAQESHSSVRKRTIFKPPSACGSLNITSPYKA